MEHQDWKSVTWTKPTEQQNQRKQNAIHAQRNNHVIRLTKLDNDTGECVKNNKKNSKNSKEFAKQLQSARLTKKMTQVILAKQINEKVSNINNYESGKIMPSSSTINKISKVLGVQFKLNK